MSTTYTHTIRTTEPTGGESLLPIRVEDGVVTKAAGVWVPNATINGAPYLHHVIVEGNMAAVERGAIVEVFEGTDEYNGRTEHLGLRFALGAVAARDVYARLFGVSPHAPEPDAR